MIIFKQELKNIFYNKRYILGFAIQLMLLFSIVPAFASYFENPTLKFPSPTIREFFPIAIVDYSSNDEILQKYLKEDKKLELYYIDSLSHGDAFALTLVIPKDYDELSAKKLRLVVYLQNFKANAALEEIKDVLSRVSMELRERRAKEYEISLETPITIERKFLKPVVIEKGGKRTSSFFLGYLIPIILFFPIFMSSSLVVDAVVAEKERKTLEYLLVSPMRRERIIIEKFLAVFTFVSLQTFLWILILKIRGITIFNSAEIFLFLVLINFCVLSLAFLLSIYANKTKGAGIALMLLYTGIFILLIVSLSVRYYNLDFLPFVAISTLAVGERISPEILAFNFIALLLFSYIALKLSMHLFRRDDIVFGPAPPLSKLFADFLSSLSVKPEALAVFSGLISFPLALLCEISLGIALLYLFGYSQKIIIFIVLTFAMIEEYFKPIVLRYIEISEKQALFLGALSGASFFFMENLLTLAIAYAVLPELVLKVLALRLSTALIVHALSTSVVAHGIARGRFKEALVVATIIHSSYNLAILFGVGL